MAQPKFSIVIPTHNRGYTLWKTILSVQNQSLSEWELLVIDDGSTGDTKKVIREFQSDRRIRYFYKKRGGVSSARNFGLELAKANEITYVDSDDIISPNYLQTAQIYLERHPTKSFAIAKGKRFLEFYDDDGILVTTKENNQKIENPTLQDFYDWSIKPSIGTGFFHKNSLKIRWNENLSLLENLDFIMQCSLVDPSGYLFIPHELYEYRQRYGLDGTCASASYKDWADAFSRIYDIHKDDPLMKNPSTYLQQIDKYKLLQLRFEKGEICHPKFKFFPELCK